MFAGMRDRSARAISSQSLHSFTHCFMARRALRSLLAFIGLQAEGVARARVAGRDAPGSIAPCRHGSASTTLTTTAGRVVPVEVV